MRLEITQVDLIAQAIDKLEQVDPSLADALVDDIIESFWSAYEQTDTEIYRARGGVLSGEVVA
jgi:hypothetical protein